MPITVEDNEDGTALIHDGEGAPMWVPTPSLANILAGLMDAEGMTAEAALEELWSQVQAARDRLVLDTSLDAGVVDEAASTPPPRV